MTALAVARLPETSIRWRLVLWLSVFGAFALAACLGAPLVGTTRIDLVQAFSRAVPFADNVDAQIFFIARLPRALAAALVGAALASAGVVLQALLRNPLATPFTLGVSAGAALGSMLAISLGLHVSVWGVSAVTAASFAGSLFAVGIVYALARTHQRRFSTNVLLLAGVTLNSFFSAVILFVQYIANPAEALRTVRWLMGNLDVAGYLPIVASLPLFAAAFLAFAWQPRALNLLSLDEDAAAARGINVVRSQQLAFFSASLATGAAVSLGGPIGFVGIVVPHLVRLLVGADHRVVLPSAALFGAAFLVVCDLVARVLLAPLELPVGIITAVIGGPFFLWLLIRQKC
ncbi:MAG: iron ABC transporter permease [Acidobacteriota bacterium]